MESISLILGSGLLLDNSKANVTRVTIDPKKASSIAK